MAYSNRCTMCNVDWPYRTEYKPCPLCRADTWLCQSGDPLTHTEAQQIIQKERDIIMQYEANERAMDRAFHRAFCERNGIVDPNERVADRASGAPLDELVC